MAGTVLQDVFDRTDEVTRFLALTYSYEPDVIDTVTDGYREKLIVVDQGQFLGKRQDGASAQCVVPYPHSRDAFHPKVYTVERGDELDILTGSFNFTRAGFDSNYETVIRLSVRAGAHSVDDAVAVRVLDFCRQVLSARRMPAVCRAYADWAGGWVRRLGNTRLDEAMMRRGLPAVVVNLAGRTTSATVRALVGPVRECHALAPFNGEDYLQGAFAGARIIYHQPAERVVHGRYSHAKVYLLRTTKGCFALVGSQNATRGGFERNVELGLLMRVDRKHELWSLMGDRTAAPPKPEEQEGTVPFGILWAEFDHDLSLCVMCSSPPPQTLRGRLVFKESEEPETELTGELLAGLVPDEDLLLKPKVKRADEALVHYHIKRGDRCLFLRYELLSRKGRFRRLVPITYDQPARERALSLAELLDSLAGRAIFSIGGREPASEQKTRLLPLSAGTIMFADKGDLDRAYFLARDVVAGLSRELAGLPREERRRRRLARARDIDCRLEESRAKQPKDVVWTAMYIAQWLRKKL